MVVLNYSAEPQTIALPVRGGELILSTLPARLALLPLTNSRPDEALLIRL